MQNVVIRPTHLAVYYILAGTRPRQKLYAARRARDFKSLEVDRFECDRAIRGSESEGLKYVRQDIRDATLTFVTLTGG